MSERKTRVKKTPSTPRSPTKKPSRAPRSARLPVSPETVAAKAYERYAARGYVHGHDWEDWFVAERELSGGKATRRQLDD
jgi:hypothetical protein